jgi:effector-binding domain-containing protein
MLIANTEQKFKNLLSLRKKMTQQDLQTEIIKIQKYLQIKSLNKIGPLITATFAVDQAITPVMDMEILIPIDKEFLSEGEYKFKKEFHMINALKIEHHGNPIQLQNTYNELNKYILENNLQPITAAYNVTVRDAMDISEIDNVQIDIYIGINPNIL